MTPPRPPPPCFFFVPPPGLEVQHLGELRRELEQALQRELRPPRDRPGPAVLGLELCHKQSEDPPTSK